MIVIRSGSCGAITPDSSHEGRRRSGHTAATVLQAGSQGYSFLARVFCPCKVTVCSALNRSSTTHEQEAYDVPEWYAVNGPARPRRTTKPFATAAAALFRILLLTHTAEYRAGEPGMYILHI